MTNPIKIYSVVSKGCIFFDGSTVQPKFLGTIQAEAHPTLNDRIIIYRTDRVSRDDAGTFRKLFRKLKIDRIQNVVGEFLVEDLGYDRDAVVAYVNAEANNTDVPTSGQSFAPGETVNFYRDETSTTVLFSNGDHHGVNSIKAVVKDNGRVGILTINADVELYEYDYEDVQIGGSSAGGNALTVVNNLNALFTVSAVPAPIPSPTYDLADVDSLVWNARETINPASSEELYGANGSSYHGARVWTTETISQPGEYFTFLARNAVSGGGALMGIGLYDAGGNDLAEILDDSLSNSGHHGYWFSNWFYNYNGYTAPWTTYGSNSGLVYGPGWNGPTTSQFRYSDTHDYFRNSGETLFRCGITDEGFVGIWYYDVDRDDGSRTNDWILCARSGTPLPAGNYGLLVKLGNTSIRITSQPGRFALEPAAPALYYRYIESPDGNFQYPLFASEEEANYVDLQNGGTGTSHAHIYPDDVTNTTWYMPDTGSTMNGIAEPVEIGVNYTEIPSLTNADQTPSEFSGLALTVDEGESVIYQTQPVDTNYTTSFSGLPSGLVDAGGGIIMGTAPEVTGDNVANPSDTYSVTVTRTNGFGSSSGTLDIVVNNLTAPPVSAINGVTLETGSTALVDSDTLADGSVVSLDNQINDGSRLVMDKDFVEDYVLPALISGSGNESVWIGFGRETGGSPDWTDGVSAADFELAFEFYMGDADRSGGTWRLRTYKQGTQMDNVGIGSNSSALYNYVFINDGGTIKMGALLPSYGDASSFVWDASAFSWERNSQGLATQSRDIYIGTSNTTFDLPNPFSGFTEVAEPVAPAGNDTDWSKALDFSGSSERAQQVNSNPLYTPLKMAGTASTTSAPASGQTVSFGHPWATAVVFKSDGNGSNQHIWNLGEGSGSNDDNIYLRTDSNRNLWFGWGRSGALNECWLGNIGNALSSWHGIYIGFNGTRLSGGHSAADIAACFDIRYTNNSSGWIAPINISTVANWNTGSYGGRMDREMNGYMTIGGRGANRNFHGKVASFVSTTLRISDSMPSTAEIEAMITDPVSWVADYKAGNSYRVANGTQNFSNFQRITSHGNGTYTAGATQVWLMGDGTNDSYSNMIRNYIQPQDQNNTKLNLISMQSNDIQNVTIQGLSN